MENQVLDSIQNVTLRDYLRVLFRHKAIIITAFVTVMVTVFFGLQFQTPVYEAKVKMLISAEKQVESPYYRELIGMRTVEPVLTQSEIVISNPVIERAVAATGLYQMPLNYEKGFAHVIKKPFIMVGAKLMQFRLRKLSGEDKNKLLFMRAVEDLKSRVKVEPIRDTNLFTISVRDFSRVGAAILANVVSRSYVIFDLEQQLAELKIKYGDKHQAVVQLQDSINSMTKSLNGQNLPSVEAIGPASVKVIEQAQVSPRPIGIAPFTTLVLAFFMSIFLGVMLAFMFEYMDQSFKSPRDIETFLNIPYLGAIPKNAELVSYKDLTEQISMLLRDKNFKSVVFTAGVANEGVSKIVANLGKFFSDRMGVRTLVIDANLRNPSIHRHFKLAQEIGLSDVIENNVSFDIAAKEMNPRLKVITAGKTSLNPITLLDASKLDALLKQIIGKFDVILIDAPDLKSYKDAAILANHTDAVAIVVNEGRTRRIIVSNAIEPLANKRAKIIGAILNNRQYVIPQFIYDRV